MKTLEECNTTLNGFLTLENGWYGPNSYAVDGEIINRCKELVERISLLPDAIFSTGRGTVQFEWYLGGNCMEIEIGEGYMNVLIRPFDSDAIDIDISGTMSCDIENMIKLFTRLKEENV